MNVQELLDLIKLGEDSKTQFKEKFTSPDALAAEIVAFANTSGGRILVGVTDKGQINGLTGEEVAHLNQMTSNVCFQKVDPNISVTTENIGHANTIVVVINVPMGPNKFYMANGSDVWVKVGADKRRAKREEMQRWRYFDRRVNQNRCSCRKKSHFAFTYQRCPGHPLPWNGYRSQQNHQEL